MQVRHNSKTIKLNKIFDILCCDQNKESQSRLFNLLESGEGVLFVGSGISRRLGYPSWEEVLKDLLKQLPKLEDTYIIESLIEKGELLLAAEIIKNKFHIKEYHRAFEEIFRPKKPTHDNFHKLLVRTKFKGFITTNYDPVIEFALKEFQNTGHNCGITLREKEKTEVYGFLKSILKPFSKEERYHLYLHGRYDLPDSTILSYGDYVEKYDKLNIKEQNNSPEHLYNQLISASIDIRKFEELTRLKEHAFRTLHYKAIYMLFFTQRLVFCGYGLRDDYLNKIIGDIKDDFNPYETNHFALMSSKEAMNWNEIYYKARLSEWKQKGIELVFFDDDDSFNGVETFFQKLSPESFFNNDKIPSEHAKAETKESQEKETLIETKNIEDENVNMKLMEITKLRAQELKQK